MKTVAEGVESKKIFDKLGEMGCGLAPGYYIIKLLTEREFRLWLHESSGSM